MTNEWTKLEGNVGELKVEFSGKEWADAQKKAFNKLSKTVRVPGFRNGKAPAAMLKKYMNMGYVLQEALDKLLEANYSQMIQDNDIAIIAQPELVIDELTEEACKLTLKIQVKPEVELKQINGFGIEKDSVEVTDTDVENELKNMQQQFAELEVKDEDATVEDGDTATIDFEGFCDGVAFEGGKGENYPLVIGSGSFIEGFEAQVVGMKANETKDIEVTFPAEYPAADLAGKPATFKVTVKEIKSRTLPAFEDLAQEAAIEGVTNLEELKANITTRLTNQKESAAQEKFTEELYNALIDANPVEIPQAMIDTEVQNIIGEIQQNLSQQGIDFTTYEQITGKGLAALKEEVVPQAEKRAKLNLILEAIVKQENITVTDEEVEEEVKNMAAQYGQDFEKVKPLIEGIKPQISSELMMRKAVDIIQK